LSENENYPKRVPLRLSEVRDEFNLSASANLTAPSFPAAFAVLSENME
jgi:hypothetical protein